MLSVHRSAVHGEATTNWYQPGENELPFVPNKP
jgi:hypothetical protein